MFCWPHCTVVNERSAKKTTQQQRHCTYNAHRLMSTIISRKQLAESHTNRMKQERTSAPRKKRRNNSRRKTPIGFEHRRAGVRRPIDTFRIGELFKSKQTVPIELFRSYPIRLVFVATLFFNSPVCLGESAFVSV